LLAIQGISEVFRAIICIRTGHWPARLSADAEETEKVLMRTSQKDEKADVI
jgi:TRAP-type mannitol/chloroaromatic compound transport system permease small subunit